MHRLSYPVQEVIPCSFRTVWYQSPFAF